MTDKSINLKNSTSATSNGKNKAALIWATVLLLLVLVVLSPVRHFEFLNFDDNVYVTENPHVNTGLTSANIKWAFTQSYAGHWHPLSWISHQIDCQIFGLNPGPPHLINLSLHTLNALLLFYILFRFFGSPSLASFCATLFALHPQRLESVAWITERKDVLSMFFGLLTLLIFDLYQKKRGWPHFLILLVFFSLGLMAKPSLVVLPVLFFLLDIWPYQNFNPLNNWWKQRKFLLEKIPLLSLSLISSIIVILAQKKEGALYSLNAVSILDRISSSFVAYWHYAFKTFFPHPIGIFYPKQFYPYWLGLLSSIAFVVFTLALVKVFKKFPQLLFGWFWFIIALLPVIGFVQVGWQSMADRWSYWPHVGISIALCGILSTFKSNKKIHVLLGVALMAFTIKTVIEIPHWKNSESIFSRTLFFNHNNFLAHTNLGRALSQRGDQKSAQWHYEQAILQNPTYPEALNNLGGIKGAQGKFNEALELFKRALRRDPSNIKTRYNVALTQHKMGQPIEALIGWLSILIDNPGYEPAKSSLQYMARHDFEMICKMTTDKILPSDNITKLNSLLQKTTLQNMNPLKNCLKQ